jgi:hypothetical protein
VLNSIYPHRVSRTGVPAGVLICGYVRLLDVTVHGHPPAGANQRRAMTSCE